MVAQVNTKQLEALDKKDPEIWASRKAQGKPGSFTGRAAEVGGGGKVDQKLRNVSKTESARGR